MNYDQICQEVIRILDLLESVPSVQDSAEKEQLAELRRDVASGLYSIVLMGEFNRGKSSILNALLGQEILPTDVLPTTAAIHILRFSPEPILRVHWRDGKIEDRALSAETLECFASVESAESLMYLEIGMPAPALAGGVVFVDTPGVDDLNKQRAEITYKFVPRSDTVVFVLDATTAVRRTEVEFLESSILASGIERLIFVANFADLLDPEDEQGLLIAIRNRLATALGGAERPIFLVSARQALRAGQSREGKAWAESGFPELVNFLETLKAEGPRSISKAKQYIHRARGIISRVALEIDRNSHLHQASDADLQNHLTALVRLSDTANVRRERIGHWTDDRENEILCMIRKSLDTFGTQLDEDIRELIVDYNGTQFQQLVQVRIPGIVKRRIKGWVESHVPAITRLLIHVNREINAGLEREFHRELSVSEYDCALSDISQVTFNVAGDDVSKSYVHAGALVGLAAGILMLAGASMLIPIVGMAGLPLLQSAVLERRLKDAKAKAVPEVAKALREGVTAFSTGVVEALRSELARIRSGAESVYDRQMAAERQRVEREMTEREGEQRVVRERADTTTRQCVFLKRISEDLDVLEQSISQEVVSA